MKSVIVHSLLALAGLVLAYQTWTREPEREDVPGSVTLAECGEADLARMRLENPTHHISVEPERSGDETVFWITSQRKPRKAEPAADGGAPVVPEEDPEQLKPKRFLANARFKDYLKKLLPVRAQQALGSLRKEQLAEFGFDKVDTKLDLQCGDKALALEAGARTFGSGQRYARDVKTQSAYLFDDGIFSDLGAVQIKYMQSTLHAFELGEVEEATIEVRGTKRRLLHRDRKLSEKALWVDSAAPTKRNELYGNWLARLWKMRALAYLPPGAGPGSDLKGGAGAIAPVLQIDYKLEGKPPGRLELVRVEQDKAHYYARSETTRGWVTVAESAAKELEQDAAMVAGLEETPPAKQQPAPAPTPAASKPHAPTET